ncbi:MAG: adenylate/guanylate cyclase domain-containing protein, partial [Proteobacteria bacterium]|nr:adenylate/guanylate cyclase domain-containing protein [Pseudomonadota bacterium]
MDPKYLDIYNAGRSSYTEEMGRPGSGTQALAKAIDKWNERTRPAAAGGPVTVMFTDLSGSTAMTQALGDEKAQVVVRTHNTVVRSALQKYGGKEIKHTGDGIMASFSTASG